MIIHYADDFCRIASHSWWKSCHSWYRNLDGVYRTHSYLGWTSDERIVSPLPCGIDVPPTDYKYHSYFRMIAVATQGGTYTAYSDRFTISGMTGTTDPAIKAAATAAGTAVPAAADGTANNAAAEAGDPNANSGVPYAEQTGLIRYAPMQSVPPTKITKKDTKPLYPTSSYKIAVSFLPTPSATKTVTATQTFSADSMENTVSWPRFISFCDSQYTDNETGFPRSRPCW